MRNQSESAQVCPERSLLKEFATARKAEDDRLFVELGGAYISVWNPRITDVVNDYRTQARSKLLVNWCQHWWQERGYIVEWLPQSTDGKFDIPSFSVHVREHALTGGVVDGAGDV